MSSRNRISTRFSEADDFDESEPFFLEDDEFDAVTVGLRMPISFDDVVVSSCFSFSPVVG